MQGLTPWPSVPLNSGSRGRHGGFHHSGLARGLPPSAAEKPPLTFKQGFFLYQKGEVIAARGEGGKQNNQTNETGLKRLSLDACQELVLILLGKRL